MQEVSGACVQPPQPPKEPPREARSPRSDRPAPGQGAGPPAARQDPRDPDRTGRQPEPALRATSTPASATSPTTRARSTNAAAWNSSTPPSAAAPPSTSTRPRPTRSSATAIWRRVPRALLGGVSGATLQSFMDQAVAALEAGTIDGREDTILCWMPVQLDQEGWDEVTATMEETDQQGAGGPGREPATGSPGARATARSRPIVGVASFETAGSREELALSGPAATPTRSSPAASRRCRGRRG